MSKNDPRARPRRRLATWSAAWLGLALAGGCINVQSERGVEPRWQELGPEAFVPGETTRAQVLDALGPPSQILTLSEGTAFYYMLEETSGDGVILLVYNTRTEVTSYDRAVFFFDGSGVLTDHAVSEARR